MTVRCSSERTEEIEDSTGTSVSLDNDAVIADVARKVGDVATGKAESKQALAATWANIDFLCSKSVRIRFLKELSNADASGHQPELYDTFFKEL